MTKLLSEFTVGESGKIVSVNGEVKFAADFLIWA